MQFNGSNIINKSQDSVFVFGKIKICEKNSFTIHFINFKRYAGIGIIDEQYKKQLNLTSKANRIRYDNNSALYDGA